MSPRLLYVFRESSIAQLTLTAIHVVIILKFELFVMCFLSPISLYCYRPLCGLGVMSDSTHVVSVSEQTLGG